MWQIFKYKSVKVKREFDNMDHVMDIVKLNKFNFLNNPNYVCECIIAYTPSV